MTNAFEPKDHIEITNFAVVKGPKDKPLVVLSCEDERAVTLPLTEHEALLLSMTSSDPGQLLPSEVIASILSAFNAMATRVVIIGRTMEDSMAELHMEDPRVLKALPCAVADALAVAKATGCPVFVSRSLLETDRMTFVWNYLGMAKTDWVRSGRKWVHLDQPDQAPMLRIFNSIFLHAIRNSASELLIEPLADRTVVRYLLSGSWQDVMTLPQYIQSSMAARLKILADLDVSVKDKSQQGSFRIRLEGRDCKAILTTQPTPYGESLHVGLEIA